MTNQASRPGRAVDPAKRAAILDGARTVFLRDGFAVGSVDDVAAEAGVGKQTIYRHFGSKEALIAALVKSMCALEPFALPPATMPVHDRLRALLRSFAAGLASPENLKLYRAIVGEAERAPELGRLFWQAGPRRIRDAIARLWAEYGEPSGAEVAASQLVMLTLGDAYQELVLGVAAPGPEAFERQIDAALAALMPRSASTID